LVGLTIFAFAFLDEVLILDILMASFAVEPGSEIRQNNFL
jgi:hypothetical protein